MIYFLRLLELIVTPFMLFSIFIVFFIGMLTLIISAIPHYIICGEFFDADGMLDNYMAWIDNTSYKFAKWKSKYEKH